MQMLSASSGRAGPPPMMLHGGSGRGGSSSFAAQPPPPTAGPPPPPPPCLPSQEDRSRNGCSGYPPGEDGAQPTVATPPPRSTNGTVSAVPQRTVAPASGTPQALPPLSRFNCKKPYTVAAVRTFLHLPPAFIVLQQHQNASVLSPGRQRHGGIGTVAHGEGNDVAGLKKKGDALADEASGLLLSAEAVLQEKERVTADYLDIIEERTDTYLQQHWRFDHKAIPYDYLDEPPSSHDAVRNNFNTLSHLITEVFNPNSGVQRQLIKPVTKQVWDTSLYPLKNDLTLTEADVKGIVEEIEQVVAGLTSLQEQKHDGEEEGEEVTELVKTLDSRLKTLKKLKGSLERDLDYLQTIEAQESNWVVDAHENVNSHAPADVVPVSGLIVSRLHRLENEHRTVMEHWKIAF